MWTDANNCGSCGNKCATGYKCANAKCVDGSPPAINITSPSNNTTISGTVDLKADASDPQSPVEWVKFSVKKRYTTTTTEICTDTSFPYACPWDTTKFADGSYYVYASAKSAGGTGQRNITVTVKNEGVCNPDACAVFGTICCPGITGCVKWWENENNCGSCGVKCSTGKECRLNVPGDYTKGASCQSGCSDECSPSGAKECTDSTHYKTCGNYDTTDTCLEWSTTTKACSYGQTCSEGNCSSALGAPTLISPINGVEVSSSPTFKWSKVSGATQYGVWVSENPTMSNSWFWGRTLSSTNCTFSPCSLDWAPNSSWEAKDMNTSDGITPPPPPPALTEGKTYYWLVWACKSATDCPLTGISATKDFRIKMGVLSVPSAAKNLTITSQTCGPNGVDIKFSWSLSETNFIGNWVRKDQWLNLSTQNNDFASGTFKEANNPPFINSTSYTTGTSSIGSLAPGATHYWRISTYYTNEQWLKSDTATFSTISCPHPTGENCQWDGSIIPCSDIYNMPIHDSAATITNTVLNTRQFANRDVSSNPNYTNVVNWARDHGWNPAFIVALWYEESGGGTNIGYMACMDNILHNLDCWSQSSLYSAVSNPATDFIDFARIQWCATSNPTCRNNPHFFMNVTDIYKDLTCPTSNC
jgi:hypothetical protein